MGGRVYADCQELFRNVSSLGSGEVWEEIKVDLDAMASTDNEF